MYICCRTVPQHLFIRPAREEKALRLKRHLRRCRVVASPEFRVPDFGPECELLPPVSRGLATSQSILVFDGYFD